jgi:sigma-B regulation protein RsbU (phosphoserine phosphatase)
MIPDKAPVVPGLDIAATYIPCFDVGGDLYDFIKVTDSCIVAVVADVIGKGVPAAMMMSMFRGAVRAYFDTKMDKNDLQKIIEKLNTMACQECRDGEFITLFCAAIDTKDMSLTYCNCGHEPTALLRDGQVTDLSKGGLVLGIDTQAEYETKTIQLTDGDCLLFYTDGLIDAISFSDQLWGRQRLLKAAQEFTKGSAEQMVKNVLAYRRRFVGLAEQIDDTSIIVVKINRPASLELDQSH